MNPLRHKLIFLATVILFSLTACYDKFDELVPDLEGVPAGGVQSVRILNVEEDKLQLEMKVFAVDHFGSFIQNLSSNNFTVTANNSSYDYRIMSVTEERDEATGPYSAGLLFDQSGSINSTDPTNDRISAGVSFADLLSGGDEAAIAAFSSGGFYQQPYELLEGFNTNKDRLVASIESLAGRAGGGTPLYRAIYDLIPLVASDAANTNKAIVAFTDGEDTDGGITIDDLVERACQEDVSIYTVGLSSGVDASVLSEIAFRTGGAVMVAKDALQLISLYSSLGALLHGEGRLYKVQIEIGNPNSNWAAGHNLSGDLNLNISSDYPVALPFQLQLTAANAGSLDQRIPDCECSSENENELVNKWKQKAIEYRDNFPDNPDLPTPNDQITCAYASIYHENPDKFKWAGLAAIVSGKIGERLADPAWQEMIADIFSDLDESLAASNKAIFEDLFWQHLAFQDGGIEEIENIYCVGGISIEVYRAWLKISQQGEEDIWEGSRDLLYHEQKNVVQEPLYDQHAFSWTSLQTWENTFDPDNRVLVSPVPGHENDEFPSDKEIEIFEHRWNWLNTVVSPAWKAYETNTINKAALKDIHESYCASCCN